MVKTEKPAFWAEIEAYEPIDDEQAASREAILWYLERFGREALIRDNLIAHITSSGFIVNPEITRTLMVHHNILNTWAWTGGHMDGEADMLGVALREAEEETGMSGIRPLSERIASVDVLWVPPHVKNGRHVSAHLHLSVAYVLVCDQSQTPRVKPDENSAVGWLDIENIRAPFSGDDIRLYRRLIDWARGEKQKTEARRPRF